MYMDGFVWEGDHGGAGRTRSGPHMEAGSLRECSRKTVFFSFSIFHVGDLITAAKNKELIYVLLMSAEQRRS